MLLVDGRGKLVEQSQYAALIIGDDDIRRGQKQDGMATGVEQLRQHANEVAFVLGGFGHQDLIFLHPKRSGVKGHASTTSRRRRSFSE
jgi:hypothetical protein